MLLSVYTFTCYALSVAPVTYYNCFYRYCDSHLFIHCCELFFLLISMHFIHLFSILLPVCFNKFSVQCVQCVSWMYRTVTALGPVTSAFCTARRSSRVDAHANWNQKPTLKMTKFRFLCASYVVDDFAIKKSRSEADRIAMNVFSFSLILLSVYNDTCIRYLLS